MPKTIITPGGFAPGTYWIPPQTITQVQATTDFRHVLWQVLVPTPMLQIDVDQWTVIIPNGGDALNASLSVFPEEGDPTSFWTFDCQNILAWDYTARLNGHAFGDGDYVADLPEMQPMFWTILRA